MNNNRRKPYARVLRLSFLSFLFIAFIAAMGSSVLAAPEFIDKNLGEYFYKFYLDENADGSNTEILLGKTTAEDSQGRSFTYVIEGIGNYWGNKKFRIDQNGKLYYKGTGENHEKGSAPGNHGFSFEIRAKVNGESISPNCHQSDNCGYAYVSIDINNVDEPPVFSRSSYTFNLRERLDGSPGYGGNLPVYVGKVSASDQDAHFYKERLTYSVADDINFTVDPDGKIKYHGSGETYEPNKKHTFVVNATDITGLNASVNVTVVVKQNVAPVFSQSSYTFDLDENAVGPISLGRVTARDGNKDALTYSIEQATSFGVKFNVNSANGEISYVGSGEDYESVITQYVLKITADDGLSNDTATVNVNLNNLNDNPTVFLNSTTHDSISGSVYIFNLTENLDGSETPIPLGRITATDLDNAELIYSEQYFYGHKYRIDSATGELTYFGTGEDYEAGINPFGNPFGDFFRVLNVLVSDGIHNERVSVLINITNVNDMPHSFLADQYNFTLDGGADGSGTSVSVGELYIEDGDRGDLADLTFSIVEGDVNDKFRVNPYGDEDARLTYIGTGTEHGSRTYYNLTILAEEGPFSATTTVIINLTNSHSSSSIRTDGVEVTDGGNASEGQVEIDDVIATVEVDVNSSNENVTDGYNVTVEVDVNSSNETNVSVSGSSGGRSGSGSGSGVTGFVVVDSDESDPSAASNTAGLSENAEDVETEVEESAPQTETPPQELLVQEESEPELLASQPSEEQNWVLILLVSAAVGIGVLVFILRRKKRQNKKEPESKQPNDEN